MKQLILVFLFVLFTNLSTSQGKFRLNYEEGIKAAESFEKVVFTQVPKLKSFISFFDVDEKDGHLMVWIEESMLSNSKSKQNEIYRTFLDMWRLTKYVQEKYYGGYLEVLYLNTYTGKTETIKFLR